MGIEVVSFFYRSLIVILCSCIGKVHSLIVIVCSSIGKLHSVIVILSSFIALL